MASITTARRVLWTLAGAATLLLLWSVLATAYPPILVPSPLDVLAEISRLAAQGKLWPELSVTVTRLLIAYGLGVSLGIALGLIAGQRASLAQFLRPMMAVAGGFPPIAWVALALIWFGTGSLTPIVVAVLVAMPVVFVATSEGVRAIDRDLLTMVRVYGLRGRHLLREFYLPALSPYLLSGLTAAATLTVRVGIMGEFLGSNSGVGSAMALARTQLNTAGVLAWIIIALALLAGIEGLLLRPLALHTTVWRRGI